MNKHELNYVKMIENIFSRRYQIIKNTSLFDFLCDLYRYEPFRFEICNEIHQNTYKDPLHFSIKVYLSQDFNNYYTIHINGYLKSIFIVDNLTIKYKRFHENIIEELATFSN